MDITLFILGQIGSFFWFVAAAAVSLYAKEIRRWIDSVRLKERDSRLQRQLVELQQTRSLLHRLHSGAYELLLYTVLEFSYACYIGFQLAIGAYFLYVVLDALTVQELEPPLMASILAGVLVGRFTRVYVTATQLQRFDSFITDLDEDIERVEAALTSN